MRRNWTREESILAVNLYCKIPFGKIHQHNPDIIELARLIGRSPGAVAWKLVNYAHLDPSLDRKGASHVAKIDREIWHEFYENWDKLVHDSEILLAQIKKLNLEQSADIPTNDLPEEGLERERIIKTRVNQNFFRKMILSSYNTSCCITGINEPQLLIGSHIIPWKADKKNRLNPRNGLCLNALHDKAFDKGLITISKEFKVILSPKLQQSKNIAVQKFFSGYQNEVIKLPDRFLPDKIFLEYHNDVVFQK
ncbi:MAG: HNH endonuclease [Bacteroidota bacterium]